MTPYQVKRQQEREQAWEYALQYTCPRCHVEPGVACINLAEQKRGREVTTTNPHIERVDPHQVDHNTQMTDEGY